MNSYPKGSEWRKWDLQVQTILDEGYVPLFSYYEELKKEFPDKWNEFTKKTKSEQNALKFDSKEYFFTSPDDEKIKAKNYANVFISYLEVFQNEECCIAITDHNYDHSYLLDAFIARAEKSDLVKIICGVEINVSGVHMLALFNKNLYKKDTFSEGIKTFLTKININNKTENNVLTVSDTAHDKVIKIINDNGGIIIYPHCNSDNGLFQERGKTDRTYLADTFNKQDFNILQGSNSDNCNAASQYINSNQALKSKYCFTLASDSRCLRDVLTPDQNGNFTWIKADPTFRGLKQICFEPETRVFIGSEPPLQDRKTRYATKFISKLKVTQIPEYNGNNGEWFKDVDIPINPELTVIIGNKGSGKSALVDIMGLLGDSKLEKYFSFLSDERFRKKGLAENFTAEIEWESKTNPKKKKLSENVNSNEPELVKYLPQSYFEDLTNDNEIEKFREKVEEVVFSHVEQTDRMGKTTFAELLEFKTYQIKQETSVFKTELRDLNREIILLEEKDDPKFKKQLEKELEAKENDLKSFNKIPLIKVPKPTKESKEEKELSDKVTTLTKKLESLKESGTEVTETITKKKNSQQKLTSLKERLSTIKAQILTQKNTLKTVCEEFNLDIESIINIDVDVSSIEKLSLEITAAIKKLEKDNEQLFTDETDFNILESLPDLRAAYKYIKEKIDDLKKKLGTPQRNYQVYLEKLAKNKIQLLEITGSAEEPTSGTINYIKSQLSYIEQTLPQDLATALTKRKDVSEKIFRSKEKILKFYEDIKGSMQITSSADGKDNLPIDINSAFMLDQSFSDRFLNYINKTKSGLFYQDGQQTLKKLLSNVTWNDFDSIYNFIEKALEGKPDNENANPTTSQVNNIKEFYDFLFSLEYFSSSYELRLDEKDLNELSPGEKGLLLLVFYLQLDKDNIPLIIDQPEDNLDNESIFKVLAESIKKAKKYRQVILVTHNPNLAIGADAEQIICVHLEKSDKHKFTYESGAIENTIINEKIVKILEGTLPALTKRWLKYQGNTS